MTPEQVARHLIDAARIERRMPRTNEGPARLKAQALPYFHNFADLAGWFPAPDNRKAEWKCMLEKGDLGRYDEERRNFWRGGKVTPEEVSFWEQSLGWLVLVNGDGPRRALRAWVASKASTKSFASWYRAEGISKRAAEGRRRAALRHICEALNARNPFWNARTGQSGTLQNDPQIGDNRYMIDADVTKSKPSWQDGAFERIPRPELQDFSWAAKRNELRRQRAARKKKKQPKAA
jgi:hypothetical protein